MRYWLLKSEPSTYSWNDLLRDGGTSWTGVRNFQARNNLRAMALGDKVFIYHSVSERSIQGIATITKVAYADPTATDGDWSVVDIVADCPADVPLLLDEIKRIPGLANMVLVKNSRLSVQPVSNDEWYMCAKKMYTEVL